MSVLKPANFSGIYWPDSLETFSDQLEILQAVCKPIIFRLPGNFLDVLETFRSVWKPATFVGRVRTRAEMLENFPDYLLIFRIVCKLSWVFLGSPDSLVSLKNFFLTKKMSNICPSGLETFCVICLGFLEVHSLGEQGWHYPWQELLKLEAMGGSYKMYNFEVNDGGQKLFLAENSKILIFAIYLVWKGLFCWKRACISLA